MAPHGSALPKATTESARAARMNFFCDLCQKGYARMPDFEAHEGSYDHQHRKRLKDMKQLTRDTGSSTSRAKGSDSGELQSISLSNTSSSGPAKKKPLFKAVGFQPVGQQSVVSASALTGQGDVPDGGDESGAVRNGWAEEKYDPRFVSGCASDCAVCGGESGRIEV